MLDCLKAINWKKTGVFAAGVLFGTAGVKVLSSKMLRKFTQTVQQQFSVQKSA